MALRKGTSSGIKKTNGKRGKRTRELYSLSDVLVVRYPPKGVYEESTKSDRGRGGAVTKASLDELKERRKNPGQWE